MIAPDKGLLVGCLAGHGGDSRVMDTLSHRHVPLLFRMVFNLDIQRLHTQGAAGTPCLTPNTPIEAVPGSLMAMRFSQPADYRQYYKCVEPLVKPYVCDTGAPTPETIQQSSRFCLATIRPCAPSPSGRRRGEGQAARGRIPAAHSLPHTDLKTAIGGRYRLVPSHIAHTRGCTASKPKGSAGPLPSRAHAGAPLYLTPLESSV
jgi:hypothetical protein